MDRHDGILPIVLPAEHLLGFSRVHDGRELIEAAREVVEDRLAPFSPLGQHGEIVGTRSQRFAEVAILLEPAPALQELLRPGLVFPEVWRRDALFYG